MYCIHKNSCDILTLIDGKLTRYTPNSEKCCQFVIDSKEKLPPVFEAIEKQTYVCIFIKFTDDISKSLCVSIVENISHALEKLSLKSC